MGYLSIRGRRRIWSWSSNTMFILALLGLISCSQASIDVEAAIPKNNWYVPVLFQGENVPPGQYDDRQCALLGSFVNTMMAQYAARGRLSPVEANLASGNFSDCREAICSNNGLMARLPQNLVLAELLSVVTSRGRQYEEETRYEIFHSLIDPVYWEILAGVPYPIVEDQHFERQQHAAYEIINHVCGFQTPDVKLKIGFEDVNKIFTDILIDEYIQGAFAADEKDILISKTDPVTLRELWNQAAAYISGGNCLDPKLASDESERTSISRVRDTADEIGILCEEFELEQSIDFGTAFPGAPGPPGTGSAGAPSSPGMESAAAPSDPGMGGGFFAP